jgi:hypothetical protein
VLYSRVDHLLDLVFLADVGGNYASLSSKTFNFFSDCTKLLVFSGKVVEGNIKAICG